MSPALVKSVKEAATAGQAQRQQENEQARAMLLSYLAAMNLLSYCQGCV
jgi:hypothetical protein